MGALVLQPAAPCWARCVARQLPRAAAGRAQVLRERRRRQWRPRCSRVQQHNTVAMVCSPEFPRSSRRPEALQFRGWRQARKRRTGRRGRARTILQLCCRKCGHPHACTCPDCAVRSKASASGYRERWPLLHPTPPQESRSEKGSPVHTPTPAGTIGRYHRGHRHIVLKSCP
jgi:hypothetical protein